jgi:hypothetical protein
METIHDTYRKVVRSYNDKIGNHNDSFICEYCFDSKVPEDFDEYHCDAVDAMICMECVAEENADKDDLYRATADFYQ